MAIYHQFYQSPYHFVAIQALAKWIHPDKFKDLDPQATYQELHQKFLPIRADRTSSGPNSSRRRRRGLCRPAPLSRRNPHVRL